MASKFIAHKLPINVFQNDANNIREKDDINEKDLLMNYSINMFLNIDRDNRFFIMSTKGFGKTLFLKYKRLLYQSKFKYDDSNKYYINLIPEGELVAYPPYNQIFNDDQIKMLEDQINWNNIWLATILLSVVKSIQNKNAEDHTVKKAYSLRVVSALLEKQTNTNPHFFLTNILELNFKDFYDLTHDELNQLHGHIAGKSHPTAIFIDNVDEMFRYHLDTDREEMNKGGMFSPDIWYRSQIGLINAVRTISNNNHHIKVFASIRKEAFYKYMREDTNALQAKDNVTDLTYTKEELRDIFIINVNKLDEKQLAKPGLMELDRIEAFIGLKEVTNSHIGDNEPIFDYMYRHTLKRPRDLMEMGREILSLPQKEKLLKENKNDYELKIKSAINSASNWIVKSYINEVSPMIHLTNVEFDGMFKLINRNILTLNDLIEVCSKYNGKKDCMPNDCINCDSLHFFCNMYYSGLLGIVRNRLNNIPMQYFLSPGEETLFDRKILPQSDYYLIHPALNNIIKDIHAQYRTDEYRTDEYGVIVGDGYRFVINRTISIFLQSSNNRKNIIQKLEEKIKNRFPRFEINVWFEDPKKAEELANSVHDKIRSSDIIISDISDYNSNVFYEVGYAIGCRKHIVLIKDAKKDVATDLRYIEYDDAEGLFSKLEEILADAELEHDKSNNFSTINFEPRNGKNHNGVIVLTSKPEDKVIKDLTLYRYRIKDINNICNYTNEGIINELLASKAILVNLNGKQQMLNENVKNDAWLMFLAGVCMSQKVPLRIFLEYSGIDEVYVDIRGSVLPQPLMAEIKKFVDSIPV